MSLTIADELLAGSAARLVSSPSLEERASWVTVSSAGEVEELEIPVSRDTAYLTHGLFRYVGKLPPPLVAYFLRSYTGPNDIIIDTMCGGGTTAIEAVSSGRRSINFDMNPVSLVVTRSLSAPADLDKLLDFSTRVLASASRITPPAALSKYFSPDTYGLIRCGLDLAREPVETALMLSIARRASFANTKKINTVFDKQKVPKSARNLFETQTALFVNAFQEMNELITEPSKVIESGAESVPLGDAVGDFLLLHPPYLTNTAFSEVTHLQLLLIGIDPLQIRKGELAYRGSYFHVPNGLKKYLVGWARIIREGYRILKPGGTLVVVVGDGSIDGVRIPVGTITEELAKDIGFSLERRSLHVLNNQTGWTLSHRMTGQQVRVFKK